MTIGRRTLDPKLDIVFWMLFGEERNRALWGKFLSATSDEQLTELAMKDPLLKQAQEALETLSADPDARILAERRETALNLYRFDIAASRREGRIEGKAQALRRLVEVRFGALPDSASARIGAATEAELDEWLERVVLANELSAVFAQEA